MSSHCNIPHPLKREGTYQWQRLPPGLKEENLFKPDDRAIEELVEQVAQYASSVRYYDTTLNEWGRWEEFYSYIYDYPSKKIRYGNIDTLLSKGDIPPHLGLLLSFLKTFETVRAGFNGFTKRHLDFYYERVLQLTKKDAVPDNVAVLFEPEKNTVQAKVEEGRQLNAGKDALSKDLVYKTTREIIVNQVSIAKKKTIFSEKNANSHVKALHIAKDAAEENKFIRSNITSWNVFGSTENELADIGFAVSSPILLAKEGRRRLSIEIEGGASLPRTSLTAWYTGPKGWVEAAVDIQPGVNSSSSAVSKKFLLIKINESLPAIAAYDEKIHKSGYTSVYPVVKLIIRNDSEFSAAFDFFSSLKAGAFKKIVMNVEGAKSFSVNGENGKLNPLQAFKPFGNIPVKNKSFFTIGCSEAFNKYLKTFHLAANWKGAPGNFTKYYSSYQTYLTNVTSDQSISTLTRNTFNQQWKIFEQGNVPGKVEILSGGKWVTVKEDSPELYAKPNKENFYNTFHVTGVVNDPFDSSNSNEFTESSRWGFAKVILGYDFGHHFFPNVLTHAVTNNAKVTTAAGILPVPPQPYTPEFNSLHLDYVLEDTIDLVNKPEHQLMQLHPFGYALVISSLDNIIAADYSNNGQLFIGLANCNSAQTVNLYIARLDGTEDIDAVINEDADWYYLNGNTWQKFKFEEISIDTTHEFTASGFISFAVPKEALAPNTLMGENLVWLKAVSASSAAAYPSVIDIHTNAVEAVFENNSNDPYHLQTALPSGSIAKPVIKIQGVKAVSQPYASYNGAMEEQDENFYTRVSERLRHKNRAWSIWDYEHLILEKFPSVYKIKTISHATQDDMFVPGHILCVALPATINIAEKDLLQPRISKAILTEAGEFISTLNTTFAKVQFINPVYEPITIKCSVQIRKGYDETYYGNMLNKDLQEFICPWIKNKSISPSFEGRIYASSVINFIEELPYIDYITDFEAFKMQDNILVSWTEFTSGSREDVILTSASQHLIDTNAIC